MNKTIIHIMPHTHWDREWYFTTTKSTVYLLNHIKKVLETLEGNEAFSTYLLDAQSSLVEDYLKYYPEDLPRIQKLVKAKRLIVGPWYTQTDQLVISAESVVRNLYYGTTIAQGLGESFKVGYVPDVFGQGGNMPQIYQGVGIDKMIFYRGVSDNHLEQAEFTWEGSDGSQVLAVHKLYGYFNGGFIPEDPKDFPMMAGLIEQQLTSKSTAGHVYFPNGFDQMPIRTNLPQLVETYNEYFPQYDFKISHLEDYFSEIKHAKIELPLLKGEFTEGKHSRVHKTIFSTRADLKQMNNKVENYLTNTMEPLLSMAYTLGMTYPHREIAEIWKLMFENAAHDSIGGCNSDSTNTDIAYRYKRADEFSTNLVQLALRKIAMRTKQENDYEIFLYNPFVYAYTGIYETDLYIGDEDFVLRNTNGDIIEYVITEKIDLTEYMKNQVTKMNYSETYYIPEKIYKVKMTIHAKEIPALGYEKYTLDLKNNVAKQLELKTKQTQVIENEFYTISYESNNSFTITDKRNGEVYKEQFIIEDNGDAGDSYNYSPPKDDLTVSSLGCVAQTIEVKTSVLEERLSVTFSLQTSKDLAERELQMTTGMLPITIMIKLQKENPTIHAEIDIENQVLSHRMRLIMDTKIASKVSTADEHFGTIQRPVYLETMENWEKEEWHETPVSVEPMQNFVTLFNEKRGMALFTAGVREYEIIGNSYEKIALTLFRTFSYMGKSDLLWRPGRASGDDIVETPDGELLGPITCHVGVMPYIKSFDENQIAKVAKEYNTVLPTYQRSDFLNNRMNFVLEKEPVQYESKYSAFSLDTEAVVSTIKKAETNDMLLMRLFNPFLEKNIEFDTPCTLGETNLLEEFLESSKGSKTLKPSEFKTYQIK